MKKILIAAVAVLAAISCGNGSKTTAEVPAAKQEANAGVVKITGSPIQTQLKSGTEIQIQKIEFMREGEYVGQGVEVAKAGGNTHYFSGTYTKSGLVFHLTGDFNGTVTVDDNKITFKPEGGESSSTEGNFTQTPPPANPLEQALFVNWKITVLEAIIERPSVKHKFSGNDANNLGTIAKFINDNQNQVVLDLNVFNKYVIKTISLSPAPEKTVKISFANPEVEPIVGTWSGLDLTKQQFSYKLDAQLDDEQLFTAETNGSFEFSSDYKTVVITLNVSSEQMKGQIVITAVRV